MRQVLIEQDKHSLSAARKNRVSAAGNKIKNGSNLLVRDRRVFVNDFGDTEVLQVFQNCGNRHARATKDPTLR